MSHEGYTDVLVIGGGFFGAYLACRASESGARVQLVEARDDLLQAASLVNQARIHNGYHYPRSILTGLRSRENFERFAQDFPNAVYDRFTHLYAIASRGSHINAQQFALFCDRIGAWYAPATASERALFDGDRVEAVFRVKEHSFNAAALREAMRDRLAHARVQVQFRERALRAEPAGDGSLRVELASGRWVQARLVLHCAYGELNGLCAASHTPLLDLHQELVEIALLKLPPALQQFGWTIMDGPFCSSLPFPALDARSLYHVRYSVHGSWREGAGMAHQDPPISINERSPRTRVQHMIADGRLFVPQLTHAEHLRSLYIVRTKLPGSARTDSRPILFKPAPGLDGLYHIMGGKLDNVYDLDPFLTRALADHLGVGAQ